MDKATATARLRDAQSALEAGRQSITTLQEARGDAVEEALNAGLGPPEICSVLGIKTTQLGAILTSIAQRKARQAARKERQS